MTARIAIRSDRIVTFCKRWRVTELALLGSVVRDDFGRDSDRQGIDRSRSLAIRLLRVDERKIDFIGRP